MFFGALNSPGFDEHVEVKESDVRRIDHSLCQDLLNLKQLGRTLHRTPAILQDARRMVIIPVMNDALKDVDVSSGRDGFEEVAEFAISPCWRRLS